MATSMLKVASDIYKMPLYRIAYSPENFSDEWAFFFLAVNEAGFKRYVIHLTDSGMTANSVNHYIRSVKVFLYWCMEQDEITPFKIKMVKAQETIKDVYTQEELCALIQPPKREDSFAIWRSWAIINFILGTAAREATVCEMQMQDISFDDRTITFRHLKNVDGRRAAPCCRDRGEVQPVDHLGRDSLIHTACQCRWKFHHAHIWTMWHGFCG